MDLLRKIKAYSQKYRTEWESLDEFKGWLKPESGNSAKAFCTYCSVELVAKIFDIKKHANTKKHRQKLEFRTGVLSTMQYCAIDGYKGGSQWFSRDGHFYVASRVRGASTMMRCGSHKCPARWTLKNDHVGPVVNQHDHPPTPWVPNRNAMFQSLKRRAATETISLNSIYEEEAARYPDAASHLLWESVVPSMRKWRRQQQPGIPASLIEYAAALAEHPRHSNLLLATVSAGGATAVILAQQGFAQCLRDSSTVVVDGTFLTVPAGLPAAQILTIHSVIEGCYFHPILVLMENRRRVLYESVFARIWQAAGNPRPAHVVTDFEPALRTALESVTGVQVQGCLFHYVQALLRRARELGIQVGRNTPGWQMVQLYGALALLPAAQVPLGLAELPAIAEAQNLPFDLAFNSYFESQWMTRVGPETYSVHGSPHQTSNVAESFHASLRRSLGASPNIWRFTDVAAVKFSVSLSRFEALRAGRLPRRNREQHYVRANIHARNERALQRGIITLREFLLATSRMIDIGAGVVVEDVPDVADEVEVALEPELVLQEPLEALAPLRPPSRRDDENGSNVADAPEREVPQNNGSNSGALLCSICQEIEPTLVLIPCGHILCAQCHLNIRNACPFCRTVIVNAQRFYL